MDLSITGLQFGAGLLVLAALVIGAILLVRNMIGSKSGQLSEKYKGTASANLKKYPEANVFNLSSTFWRLGLVCSIGLSILAFSWTTYDETINVD
ncbi:MAG: protein TonB, partial [Saprospiraceae bacterium]